MKTDIRVLAYHSISGRKNRLPAGIDLHPDMFRRHIETLIRFRHKIMPLDHVVDNGRGLALTFDDGYEDNFINARPILTEHSIPAVIFVASAYIGKGFETEDGLNRVMNKKQLREISQDGLIEIGSHSHTHPDLRGIGDARLFNELADSRKILEDITGKKTRFLAYPFGAFDQRVKDAASAAGYEAAFSVWTKNPDRFSLNRIPIAREDGVFRFLMKTGPFYFPLKRFLRPGD